MRYFTVFFVVMFLLNLQHSNAASFSNDPVQRVFFYKPTSDGSTSTLVSYYDNFILTKGDEKFKDSLKSRGVTTPIFQYLLANEIENPGSCSAQPSRNQAADRPGDFCNISKYHPDWFLLDKYGSRISHPYGSRTFYYMDPGSSGWRSFWLQRARETQETRGWDAIYVDNVEASINKFKRLNKTLQKYTSDSSWSSAVKGYLNYIYNGYFKPAGRPMHANVVEVNDPAIYFSYLAYMDGTLNEGFAVDWQSGYRSTSQWEEHLSRAESTQAQGKRVSLVAQGYKSNTTRQQFAYVSYLLIANGKASFRYADNSNYREPWIYSNYSLNLGIPLGKRYLQSGKWYRDFSKGRVWADPVNHTSGISTW